MSYILDALRRSEQERHQEQVNSFTGQDIFINARRNQMPVWPYVLIAVLLLNAVLLAVFFFNQNDEAASVIEPKGEAASILARYSHNAGTETKPPALDIGQTVLVAESGVQQMPEPKQSAAERVDQSSSSMDKQQAEEGNIEELEDRTIYIDGGLLIQPKHNEVRTVAPNSQVSSIPYMVVQAPESVASEYEDAPFLRDMTKSFQRSVPKLTFNSHIYSSIPSARRVMINNIYLSEGQEFSGMTVVEIGEVNIVFHKNGTLFKRPVMRDW